MKVPGVGGLCCWWLLLCAVTATLRSPALYFSVSYPLSAEISGVCSPVVTPCWWRPRYAHTGLCGLLWCFHLGDSWQLAEKFLVPTLTWTSSHFRIGLRRAALPLRMGSAWRWRGGAGRGRGGGEKDAWSWRQTGLVEDEEIDTSTTSLRFLASPFKPHPLWLNIRSKRMFGHSMLRLQQALHASVCPFACPPLPWENSLKGKLPWPRISWPRSLNPTVNQLTPDWWSREGVSNPSQGQQRPPNWPPRPLCVCCRGTSEVLWSLSLQHHCGKQVADTCRNVQKPQEVAHAFNPSTWEAEAEAGEFLSSRSAWAAEWVPGQPGLHRETLSRNKKHKTKQKKRVFLLF
jgi:hypothetical protein